jgi:hypothetical protein
MTLAELEQALSDEVDEPGCRIIVRRCGGYDVARAALYKPNGRPVIHGGLADHYPGAGGWVVRRRFLAFAEELRRLLDKAPDLQSDEGKALTGA